MSHKFLLNASFHWLLMAMDKDLATQAREQGCPYCGHPLHQANYPRSPLGLLRSFREYYTDRFSLCCNTCRKRTTPPSVRFFGRRRFPALLLLFISILSLGINARRLAQVKRHFGITLSESTWKRWRRWWRESFMGTRFWRQTQGIVVTTIMDATSSFPRVFLALFKGSLEEKMSGLLRWLSPLTGGVLRAV